MDNCLLTTLALLLLLSAAPLNVNCIRFIIVPTVDTPCPGEFTGDPCITLQQYLANPSRSNVTLELQPGDHRLDSSLLASSIDSFSMTASTTASVTCTASPSLILDQLQNIYIRGITFVDCRINILSTANAMLVMNSFINRTSSEVLYVHRSSMTLDQCTFMNNVGRFNGVVNIINLVSSSVIIISQTDFIGTPTDNNRGTVLISGNGGQLIVVNSNFDNNIGTGSGGAIYVRNNERFSITITNSTFCNNSARGYGGAVYSTGGNITVTGSTFISNTAASGGGGGAIYSNRRYANISIIDSTFTDNSASFCGAIDVDEFNHYSVVLLRSTFSRNTANGQVAGNNGGGVFCIRNSSVLIQDSVFSHNRAAGTGGVSVIDESDVMVLNSNFTNNSAVSEGGVFYTYFYQTQYTITQSRFTENQAGSDGGVIYIGRADSLVSMCDNTMIDNHASNRGGVISIAGSTLHVAGDNSISGSMASFGAIASACSSNVSFYELPVVETPDTSNMQCRLYDHDTNAPPGSPQATSPPNVCSLETPSEITTDPPTSTDPPTTPDRPPTPTPSSSPTTPERSTDDATSSSENNQEDGNLIAYISLGISVLFSVLFVVQFLIVILLLVCARKIIGNPPTPGPQPEGFNLTTNALYNHPNLAKQPPKPPVKEGDPDFDYSVNASYQTFHSSRKGGELHSQVGNSNQIFDQS